MPTEETLLQIERAIRKLELSREPPAKTPKGRQRKLALARQGTSTLIKVTMQRNKDKAAKINAVRKKFPHTIPVYRRPEFTGEK